MQLLSNWWYGMPATARPPSPPNPQTSAQLINGTTETIEGLYMKRAQLVKKSEALEIEARKRHHPRRLHDVSGVVQRYFSRLVVSS